MARYLPRAARPDVDLTVAPLTQAGQESLPDYLKDPAGFASEPHPGNGHADTFGS